MKVPTVKGHEKTQFGTLKLFCQNCILADF